MVVVQHQAFFRVAGHAGEVGDDGLAAADEAVEQAGLADVGSADDGDFMHSVLRARLGDERSEWELLRPDGSPEARPAGSGRRSAVWVHGDAPCTVSVPPRASGVPPKRPVPHGEGPATDESTAPGRAGVGAQGTVPAGRGEMRLHTAGWRIGRGRAARIFQAYAHELTCAAYRVILFLSPSDKGGFFVLIP